MKLRSKLIVVGVLILLVPLLLVGGYSVISAGNALVSVSRSSIEMQADGLAKAIGDVLASDSETIVTVATLPDVRDIESWQENPEARDRTNRFLGDMVADERIGADIQVAFIADQNGIVQAASEDSYLQLDVHDRQYFRAAMQGETTISAVGNNRITGESFVPFAAPVFDRQSSVVGAAVFVFDPGFLTPVIETARFGETGYAFIADADGLIIAHPDESVALTVNLRDLAGMEVATQRMLRAESGTQQYVYQGLDKTMGFAPIEIAGWSVAMTATDEEFLEPVRNVRNAVVIMAVIAVAVAILIFALFARSISSPLVGAVVLSESVSQGDLTAAITSKGKDEIGALNSALSTMVDRLSTIVSSVRASADHVSSGARELSSSATQLSQGAAQQAAAAEEVSSAMEQMDSNIRNNADNAIKTKAIAEKAAADAQEGGDAVRNTVDSMRQISEKITIVEEIARQTNLLALNAAIEAARAGESGKGFAVVAAEVRKLAERSQKAAGEITDLANSSVQIAETAGSTIESLVPGIQKTADLVLEIESSSREQSLGATQINKALGELDKVVQVNASSSEEMASTTEELAGQAEALLDAMKYFKLNGAHQRNLTETGAPKIVKRAPTREVKPAARNTATANTATDNGAIDNGATGNGQRSNGSVVPDRVVTNVEPTGIVLADLDDNDFEQF